jgi:hypothetical protein
MTLSLARTSGKLACNMHLTCFQLATSLPGQPCACTCVHHRMRTSPCKPQAKHSAPLASLVRLHGGAAHRTALPLALRAAGPVLHALLGLLKPPPAIALLALAHLFSPPSPSPSLPSSLASLPPPCAWLGQLKFRMELIGQARSSARGCKLTRSLGIHARPPKPSPTACVRLWHTQARSGNPASNCLIFEFFLFFRRNDFFNTRGASKRDAMSANSQVEARTSRTAPNFGCPAAIFRITA